jgi:outer membrane scaffolding protein for murein synthesis (MipA/OmpV family)
MNLHHDDRNGNHARSPIWQRGWKAQVRGACFIALFFLLGASPMSAIAGEVTTDSASHSQWEFGIGLGGLSIPHYRGSGQSYEYLAPIPYVRYHGDRLKVDREGGRYYFYDARKVKLDLSATFSFPVKSDENTARQGMPDIDALLELGPRLQWYIWESEDSHLRLRVGAPLRVAINLSTADNEGVFFSPYFQIRYYSVMETAFSMGPMWASEKYHDYFYEVDSRFATSQRPAYDARAGYSGFRFTLTTSHRISKRYWWGGFVRYDTLSGAVFEDSPLVRQKDSLMAGFAIAYIFNPVKKYYKDKK